MNQAQHLNFKKMQRESNPQRLSSQNNTQPLSG